VLGQFEQGFGKFQVLPFSSKVVWRSKRSAYSAFSLYFVDCMD
jgi:hypothetical protein